MSSALNPRDQGPLEGIRVLDFTSVVAGPLATLTLAYLGADVVKIERIDGGDDSRHMGPHLGEWGSAFVPLNRGKRSIAVDVKKPEGRELVLRLASTADVLVENFRGEKMAALGLGEAALRARNPRIIYASLTAFGSSGPDALKPGYEALLQAHSGIMSVTGPGPDAPPVRSGVPIVDGTAGLWIVIGILSALFERERSGQGQRIRTSLLESGVMMMFHHLLGTQFVGVSPVPQGSQFPSFGSHGASFYPYGAFEALDGSLMVGVSNDRIFKRFCNALERPEWIADPRFVTNVLRVAHRAELQQEIRACLRQRPVAHWKVVFDEHDVPVAPIQNAMQVMNDAQVRATAQLETVVLPGYPDRPVESPRPPLELSETPGRLLGSPPGLGEHSREILKESGYGDAEIDRLLEDGVCRLAEGEVLVSSHNSADIVRS